MQENFDLQSYLYPIQYTIFFQYIIESLKGSGRISYESKLWKLSLESLKNGKD